MSHQRERETKTLVCASSGPFKRHNKHLSRTETRLTAHTDTRLDQLVHRLSKIRNNRLVISACTKVKQIGFFCIFEEFLKMS